MEGTLCKMISKSCCSMKLDTCRPHLSETVPQLARATVPSVHASDNMASSSAHKLGTHASTCVWFLAARSGGRDLLKCVSL